VENLFDEIPGKLNPKSNTATRQYDPRRPGKSCGTNVESVSQDTRLESMF